MRGYAVTHPPGAATLPIEAGWDQLLSTAAGTMTVITPAGSWTVPPQRALWIPDRAAATVRNRFPVAVRSLYFDAGLAALPPQPRSLTLSALARELLVHAVRACPLERRDPVSHALVTVVVDQLRRLPESGLFLPTPTDPRAAIAAAAIREDPTASLADVARACGAGVRTLERCFRAGTGTSLGAWRRRARILGSLDDLAAGASVTDAAMAAGYGSPSAFVTAFRDELGTTPGRFLRR